MTGRPIARSPRRSIARSIISAIGADPAWLPQDLFASGELGAVYDPSVMSTLYQTSDGASLVTVPAQPVGLMRDSSMGGGYGPEQVINGDFSGGTTGWSYETGSGMSVVDGELSIAGPTVARQILSITVGKTYIIEVDCYESGAADAGVQAFDSIAGSVLFSQINSAAAKTVRTIFTASGTTLTLKFFNWTSGQTMRVSRASIRSLPGHHARQPTAAARPLYRAGPARLDYDGVDDALVTSFPATLGSACTVGRAVPGVGAQLLTPQTIGTSYSDSMDHCGLVIVNRPLTPGETAHLTHWLNERAGL